MQAFPVPVKVDKGRESGNPGKESRHFGKVSRIEGAQGCEDDQDPEGGADKVPAVIFAHRFAFQEWQRQGAGCQGEGKGEYRDEESHLEPLIGVPDDQSRVQMEPARGINDRPVDQGRPHSQSRIGEMPPRKDQIPGFDQDAPAQSVSEQGRGDGKRDEGLPVGYGEESYDDDLEAEDGSGQEKDRQGQSHRFSDPGAAQNGRR